MLSQQITALSNEIEELEKSHEALDRKVASIDSYVKQKNDDLDELRRQQHEVLSQIEHLGFFSRKEHKRLSQEILPELNAKINSLRHEAGECSSEASVIKGQMRELQRKGKQLLDEKEALMKKLRIEQASQGDSMAQYEVGSLYLEENKYEQAVRLLEQAAQNGVSAAQKRLGMLYLSGQGSVLRDLSKAQYWLEKAAEQGDTDCQFETGELYYGADNEKAAYWYEQAAKSNHMRANRILAEMHSKALFSGADAEKGYSIVEKLVRDFGNPTDIIVLGILNYKGKGTQTDESNGVRLIQEGISKFEGAVPWAYVIDAAPILIIEGAQTSDRRMIENGMKLSKSILPEHLDILKDNNREDAINMFNKIVQIGKDLQTVFEEEDRKARINELIKKYNNAVERLQGAERAYDYADRQYQAIMSGLSDGSFGAAQYRRDDAHKIFMTCFAEATELRNMLKSMGVDT